nr:immunoglobulin light chain junction region [Macaca mulatta]
DYDCAAWDDSLSGQLF